MLRREPAYLANITQSFFLHQAPFGKRLGSLYASGPTFNTSPTLAAICVSCTVLSDKIITPFVFPLPELS